MSKKAKKPTNDLDKAITPADMIDIICANFELIACIIKRHPLSIHPEDSAPDIDGVIESLCDISDILRSDWGDRLWISPIVSLREAQSFFDEVPLQVIYRNAADKESDDE